MNNEPVAWMMKAREPSLHCPDYVTFETPTRDMKISHHPYPLYTHPAMALTEIIEKNKPEIEKANAYIKSLKDEIESLKAKTLTDEDIEPLILKMPYEPSENELYEFAYDVLRKAQEK